MAKGSEQAAKLRAAGWRVLEGGEVFHVLGPGDNPQHGWEQVLANPDGSMHLVTERSDTHRRIKAVLG